MVTTNGTGRATARPYRWLAQLVVVLSVARDARAIPWNCINYANAHTPYRYNFDRGVVDQARVNAAVAAQLAQSNLFNSGIGLLDITGNFTELMATLSSNVRAARIDARNQGRPDVLEQLTNLETAFQAFSDAFYKVAVDVTNADLNTNFAATTVPKILSLINELNILNNLLYGYYNYTTRYGIVTFTIDNVEYRINFQTIQGAPRRVYFSDGAGKLFEDIVCRTNAIIDLAVIQERGLSATIFYPRGYPY